MSNMNNHLSIIIHPWLPSIYNQHCHLSSSLVITGLKHQHLSHHLSIRLSLLNTAIINQLQPSGLWLHVGFSSSYICI